LGSKPAASANARALASIRPRTSGQLAAVTNQIGIASEVPRETKI
jgi:hypothetical protein